eukprot:jgi/Picsp_1/5005/NSC_02368-R1_hypothetical protein CHLNCDRAFT_50458 [Chlorella variabilis]
MSAQEGSSKPARKQQGDEDSFALVDAPQVCGHVDTSDSSNGGVYMQGKDGDGILQRDLQKVREDELIELLDEVSVITGPRQQGSRAGGETGVTHRRSRGQGGKTETLRDDMGEESSVGVRGFAESSWSFVGDPCLEPAYMIHLSEKSRGVTLRLHCIILFAWLVGLAKSFFLFLTRKYESDASYGSFLHPLGVLVAAQISVAVQEVMILKTLFSMERKKQLMQEFAKFKLHTLLHLAVMGVVIVSRQDMPHSPSHIQSMIFCIFISVVDRVPMRHLMRLHVIKVACYLALEGYFFALGTPGVALLRQLLMRFAALVLFGTALPLWFAACTECRDRVAFLRDCNVQIEALGPLWKVIHRLCLKPEVA